MGGIVILQNSGHCLPSDSVKSPPTAVSVHMLASGCAKGSIFSWFYLCLI